MQFTIDRAALLRSLSHVQGVVERRNTIPILANVLIRAEGDTLSLTTTDMDLEMNEAVAAEVSQSGATTVPALTFHDIVRKIADGDQITITLDESQNFIRIQAGRSNFKLSSLPPSDFPKLGESEFESRFDLEAQDLRRLIDKTRASMSNEETRHFLNGIYFHVAENGNKKSLRAVSTDGHRLSLSAVSLPNGADTMPNIILPRKAVVEVRKLIEDAADTIQVQVSQGKARFAFDNIVMVTKLIEGTYPDYTRVIPTGNDKTVELDPKKFTSSIDRVSTISDGKTRSIKITMNGKSVTLSASSPDAGSATEDIEVMGDTQGLEIGFNARYLLDITGQIEGDMCQMILADAASPTIIKDTANDDDLFVIMPLRV